MQRGPARSLNEQERHTQPSAWAYCLYELQKLDAASCAGFAESIADMRLEGRGDPRRVLLEIFHRAATGQRRKPGVAEAICIVFRAWNAWGTGQKLNQIIPGKADSYDKGGCVALLTSPRLLSKNAPGMTPNSCLIEIEKWEG